MNEVFSFLSSYYSPVRKKEFCILLGSGKELEIAKQLFDTAMLSDHLED